LRISRLLCSAAAAKVSSSHGQLHRFSHSKIQNILLDLTSIKARIVKEAETALKIVINGATNNVPAFENVPLHYYYAVVDGYQKNSD
jgi:hypothetical protein